MNKIFKLFMLAVVVLGFSSCYNEFEEPAPAKVWTKEDFSNSKLISIKDFKQLFYKEYGNGAASLGKTLEITEDYVISGKVISSDQAGNVYKSVYIYDESSKSAIELKLMVSNYVYFHVGQTLFVKTKGLAIGSYRYMLSVGGMPTAEDISKGYANRNLENTLFVDQHVFKGELGSLTEDDILVINENNYKTELNDDALGRLVRFEGLTPTYAYSYGGNRYYGSSWFAYDNATSTGGNYILRVSGYSNFALQPLPADGAKGNITAIYTKYSSKSGGYIKYQLLVNSMNDIDF